MITLEMKGLNAVLAEFKNYPEKVQNMANAELKAWADDVARDAKANLQGKTSNTGALARSIAPIYGNGSAAVAVNSNYAAYVEFGTRKFASQYVGSLPDEWQKMASGAKGGGGGNFDQFSASMLQWVKDRGIDQKALFPIMRKILRDGVRPQPFLYPAVNKNTPLLIQRLKNLLK